MDNSGDYISRDAAIEAMYKDAEAHQDHTFWTTQYEALMSILIKGMEMPKSCGYCPLRHEARDGDECYLGASLTEYQKRPEDCPLVPVPPHGRLIDADALMKEFEKAQRTMEQHGQEYSCSFLSSSREISTEWYCVEDMLENAPTVIEAEEGE